MNDFSFSVPQNIIAGRGSLHRLSETMRSLGAAHGFIISGSHLAKIGVVQDCIQKLASAGILTDSFTETEKNPSVETVDKAAAQFKACGADCIIALAAQMLSHLEQKQKEAETKVTRQEAYDKAIQIMKDVGIQEPERRFHQYPHEFSGSQRQRFGIARAIVMNPELIIADEPVSALDVSIQAQVINLLNELREEMGLAILFIAHDLSVVKYFSDRMIVMYFGKIVEIADSDELFVHPLHPYTCSLLSAIPLPDPHYEKHRKRMVYIPDEAHDYSQEQPVLREVVPGHFVRCNSQELEACLRKLGKL